MHHPSHQAPPHIYLDDTWYFITASNYQRKHLLKTHAAKTLLLRKINERTTEYGIDLKAWVILDNHYHMLIKSRLAKDLPRFFQRLHAGSALELNDMENQRGRKVWHSFWDTCIRDKRGFWTRFNYIHNNPVKHGYVRKPRDWQFSSYHQYLEDSGAAWMQDRVKRYPAITFVDEEEQFL